MKSLKQTIVLGAILENRDREVYGMPKMRSVTLFFCLLIIMGLPLTAQAGNPKTTGSKIRVNPKIYTKDRISFQMVSGAIFSPFALASRTPVLNYAQTNLRLGWMLTDPSGSAPFTGNWELIMELTNAYIYKGFGHYIGGLTGLFRYNFVQPDAKIIPYFQLGAGIVYNDAYKDDTQSAIGQAIEFTPQASLGLHYLLSNNWTIDAEAIFHHISNAGLDHRNRGINAFGGFIGLTYLFDTLWQ